jgi:stage V sporulation protein R
MAERAPEKDVLRFILTHGRALEDWQRDILTVVRDEMLYFWPQIETKIMNEGWATYWHLRILRELELTGEEAVDFARTHAGVVVPSRMSINPYLLGLKLWEDIEKRLGREAMFEIRETDSDSSFIRNYLTEDIVRDLDLYLYQKIGNEWRVVEKNWEKVRDKICASRVNGGHPVILVKDGDHLLAGELYLWHSYEGVELDVKHTEKTLPHVHRLWGRTVHLETVLEGRSVLFTCDGKKVSRRFL